MKSRKRQTVRNADVENLEGRTLLSGVAHPLRHAAAHVMRLPHAKTHLGAFPLGNVNTSFTYQNTTGAINGKSLRNNLALLNKLSSSQTTTSALSPFLGVQTFPGSQTNLAALQQGIGLGPRISMSSGSVTNGATFLPIQIGATGATGSVSTSSAGSTQNTTATLSTSGSSSVGSTLTTIATLPSTPSSAPAQTTTTGPIVASPITLSGPGGLLGNVSLSASDVSSLKSAVDTFASSYTSGANASADSTAVSTLQSALKSLDSTIFSESHVVASSDLGAFQQAVNTFVSNYTSGKDPAADSAAWSAFQTALGSFGQSVQSSSMPSSTSPGGNGPIPMPLGGLGMGMGMPGMGLTGLLGGVVSGQTLTSAQVSSLKAGIDAFASSYTSGANPTTDASAVSTLESSLDGLLMATPMATMTTAPGLAWFGPATLTKAQVTKIQTAVDTFATNYTSGANPQADSTALTALQTGLKSLAPTPQTSSTSTTTTASPPVGGFLGTLGTTPLTKSQVPALKSAVDTFASTYTSGTNPTADSAALANLETSLTSVLPAAPPMARPTQGFMMTTTSGGAPPGSPGGVPNGMG
jgi:hypothetical protein